MQSPADKVWTAAQELLRTMLNADIYNLWFAPIQAQGIEAEIITLAVANDFCELWLKDNYLGLIQDVLVHASGQPLKVKFVVRGDLPAPSPAPESKGKAKDNDDGAHRNGQHRDVVFNPKNTFESFVVGNNNNF